MERLVPGRVCSRIMRSSESDIGVYNKDPEAYGRLVGEMLSRYPDGVQLSAEYADWVHNNQLRLLIRLARYKFVAKMIKASDRVLEVGSGSGLGSLFLGQFADSVLGIDVKGVEVDEARNLNQRDNVAFEVADLFDLRDESGFDVVVSLDVIEHLSVEEGRRLLKAKRQLLRPGGMLIVGTPSIWSYPYQSPISQASHVNCYDLPDLVELVDEQVQRTLTFSMNDEVVHTGYHKMAWYYFVIGFGPRTSE